MANRYWVGGTGNWNSSDTTHWSASTGGAAGASAPGSADIAILDGASGGGVVTVTSNLAVQGITSGAFVGTLDFNDFDVTISAAAGAFSFTGTAVRTINMGNGTMWINSTAVSVVINAATATNLTFNAEGSTIIIGGSNASRRRLDSALTFNNVRFETNPGGGAAVLSGANTFANLIIEPGVCLMCAPSVTQTLLNAPNWVGTAEDPILIVANSDASPATITCSSGAPNIEWCGIRMMTFTGTATWVADDSFDHGRNTGIVVNEPVVGGGGVQPIKYWDGDEWVGAVAKFWNGSAWETV